MNTHGHGIIRQFGALLLGFIRGPALPGALLLVTVLDGSTFAQTGPDEGLRSPRATVRTLLTAITVAHADPTVMQRAISCLDLGVVRPEEQSAALLATHLEAVFRALDVDTSLIPDHVDGLTYIFPEWHGQRMSLQRMVDGRWLFDRETVAKIPKLYAEAHKQLLERNKDAAALNVSPHYDSPRATVRTLISAFREQDYHRVLHTLDLESIPAVAREEVGTQLANKLKQILLRQPRMILQEIPDSNYSDPYLWVSRPEGRVELIRLTTGPRKGEWVFSRETVRTIDNLYSAVEDEPYNPEVLATGTLNHLPSFSIEPELWLRSNLPASLRATVFKTRYTEFEIFELVGYVLLPLMALAIVHPLIWILTMIMQRALARAGWPLAAHSIRRRLKPASWFVCANILRWSLLLLEPDKVVLIPLLAVLNPLVWLLGAWAAMSLLDLVTDLVESHLARQKGAGEIAQMFWPVGSLVFKIGLLVILVFHLMEMFAWDATAVLTGLGIGGLAVALGAQDVLKNFFGSLTLIADRPFLVGESVKIGGHQTGVVEVVGLRSTRIRTTDDTLLVVPNSNLTTTEITNYGKRRYRRFALRIALPATTTRPELVAFRDGVEALIRRHPRTRRDEIEVVIQSLTSAKAEFLVESYFDVADRQAEMEARQALILDITDLAAELKLELVELSNI